MDKKRLNLLINNPKLLSAEDYDELSLLKAEFPYMQGIQPLIVLSAKRYSKKDYKKSLQTAAIYSLDRVHLKELLVSLDFKVEDHVVGIKQSESKSQIAISPSPISTSSAASAKHLPDSFFKEFYEEMDKLRQSKAAYNSTLKRLEESSNEKTSKKRATPSKLKNKEVTKKEVNKDTTASKRKAKASNTSKTDASQKKPTKKKAKPEPVHHTIIEEIKLKEIKAISDEHLMEQINLITSFIEKEPSINKKMLNNSVDAKRVVEDLSESSTQLSDDVISETLAKLMIKQGRKEKAIDIYKKLIWKFPQKKAYFADQIKSLKIEE